MVIVLHCLSWLRLAGICRMGGAVVFCLSNLPELLQGLVLRTVVVVNLFMAVVTVKLLDEGKVSLSRGVWDAGCPFGFHVFVEWGLIQINLQESKIFKK